MNISEKIRKIIQDELCFASEAAEYLGISAQRLNQLVHSGQITPIKVFNGKTLFLKRDLDLRIKLLKELCCDIKESVGAKKMNIKNNFLNEVICYYSIQSLLEYSDKKTEPIFENLSNKINLSLPMENIIKEICSLIKISSVDLQKHHTYVSKAFEKLNEQDIIVKKGEKLYPTLLAKTEEAPPYLFMRGNPDLLKERIVSVVGTRNPSEEGADKAFRLARLLGKYSIVVASGLAKGIDTNAHKGALLYNQPTVAVIGTPITKVYPPENVELQEMISQNGLVISQFPPSAKVQRWFFPMRNAVMSGISLATAIVEAGETSGALKQADYALKQGRLVFIPQSALDNPNIMWPKKYIQREGAKKFSKIEELLIELRKMHIISEINDQELNLFDKESKINVCLLSSTN